MKNGKGVSRSLLFPLLFFMAAVFNHEQAASVEPEPAGADADLQRMVAHFEYLHRVETEKLRLRDWLAAATVVPHVPSSAVAVVYRDRVVFENTLRSSPRRLYSIASFTKTFIAIAVLQLVDEGKISLDDPVNRYLPLYLENPRLKTVQITFRHLLTHTSGLTESGKVQLLEMNQLLFLPEQRYPAGYRFCYANQGYNLLGHLVTAVSGMPLHEYVRERICVPLEMFDTVVPENVQGAGGIQSTLADLSKYLVMLLNRGTYNDRRIISERMYEQIFVTPLEMPTVERNEYRGIAFRVWSIGGAPFSINHAALWSDIGGWMQLFPGLGVGYVFMTDTPDHNTPEYTAFYRGLKSRLLRLTHVLAPGGPDPVAFSATVPGGAGLEPYAGSYVNRLNGNEVAVSRSGDLLIIRDPRTGRSWPASPQSTVDFLYIFPGQAELGLAFEFTWRRGAIVGLSTADGYYEKR